MAGLYIKELLLRGDVQRCLVVVPGGLVEQWQDELYLKFGLRFDILDVTEWAAAATAPMTSVDLGERMAICEQFVLNGVINPLATGNIKP